MGVSFGRSRIADLAFQVFARPIHPEWFAVRAHRRICQEGWEAHVRVIEGGHAVNFLSGAVRLTEVLSGPETLLPEPGLLFHSGVRGERSARLRPRGELDYRACFEVERVPPEVFDHLTEEITLDATRGGIFHRFAPSNRLLPAPISLVTIEPMARGLTIHAVHTFPDERAIVRTQSLFEPRVALSSR